jgi:hypothetical protein
MQQSLAKASKLAKFKFSTYSGLGDRWDGDHNQGTRDGEHQGAGAELGVEAVGPLRSRSSHRGASLTGWLSPHGVNATWSVVTELFRRTEICWTVALE